MGKDRKPVDPALNLLGGAISGGLACVLLQPLDLIKTVRIMWSLRAVFKARSQFAYKHSDCNNNYSKDDPIPFYHPTASQISPYGQQLAVWYNRTARAGLRRLGKVGMDRGWGGLSDGAVNLVAGAGARVGAGFALMPLSVIKVRYESNFYNYRTMWDATRSIFRESGFRGFFYGFGATALRDAPSAGLYLFFYEHSKSAIHGWTLASPYSPPAVNMVSAAVSSVGATLVTQPFDMIRTRMQLRPLEYTRILTVMSQQAEGMMGFFSGMIPRLMRKPISSAITWTVYEEIVRWGNRHT
ncbi:hypothetical protein HK104_003823 [Borealophlyctis nickersoniae]|nr:hypothetical protein HK104_003823 [Borealophlyctis nickersoniae]